MKVSGKSLHLDITNVYRNVTNPIWAFVVFQTNKLNNQLKDNSTFDHTNVKTYGWKLAESITLKGLGI
jgi:hypothetical protein